MQTNNQNQKSAETNQATAKTAATPSTIHELYTPIDEKPSNVLQSWQNLRQLDNNLANQQGNDLPVD